MESILARHRSVTGELRAAAESEYDKLVRGNGGITLEGHMLITFLLSRQSTSMETEHRRREEEGSTTMRTTWAEQDHQKRFREAQRQRQRSEQEEILAFNLSRVDIVTDDVMEEVLRRYRIEDLRGRSARNDAMRNGDSLYPFLNTDTRAKEIIREVVVEMKGEAGAKIVEEVRRLEQLLVQHGDVTAELLREHKLLGAQG